MIIYLSGGCKNGKSHQALAMARALGGKNYYIATMIPHDGEDADRIARHRMARDGLGFETIECGVDIGRALNDRESDSTVLLDSITALLANEMFTDGGLVCKDAPAKIVDDLLSLTAKCRHLICVSDYVYSDAMSFGRWTEVFRMGLARIDNAISARADLVYEVVAGIPILHKKEETWPGCEGIHLITGGEYQGKSAYARRISGVDEEDICRLTDDSTSIDFTAPVIAGLEQFALSCVLRRVDPTEYLLARRYALNNRILILSDITCGLPTDKRVEGAWRAAVGNMLSVLSKEAESVTRMVLGIPCRLK